MQIAIAILSAVFSGIMASIITLKWQSKNEKRKYKMEIFQMMIAHRNDLTPGRLPSGKFEEAVNQIFIAYNDCDKVIKAFEEFRSVVLFKDNYQVISKLVTLLKEMANELHIKYDFSNDDLFTNPINIGR